MSACAQSVNSQPVPASPSLSFSLGPSLGLGLGLGVTLSVAQLSCTKRNVHKTILRFCWPNGVLRLVLHALLVKNDAENNATAAAAASYPTGVQ